MCAAEMSFSIRFLNPIPDSNIKIDGYLKSSSGQSTHPDCNLNLAFHYDYEEEVDMNLIIVILGCRYIHDICPDDCLSRYLLWQNGY